MTTGQLQQHWPEWEIEAELGSGSFGTVYRIKRAMFGDRMQYAALKVIHIPKNQVEVRQLQSEGMDDASVSAYFQSFVQNLSDEIDLLSRLKGTSNIVSYEDHKIIAEEGRIGWTILIRMELLVPLNDHLRQHPMSQRETLQLGADICKALELCEKHRIIHRDIKPDNIFISPNGDFKLGDFGVARELEKTTIGLSRKGTFNYMAPEVFHGKPYNATVDIYSLGIVLYRLLNNNRTPFLPPAPQPISYNDREQAQQLLLSGTSIPPLKHVPAALNRVILKMCAHHPADRYQNAAALQAALEAVVRPAAAPPPVSAPPLTEDEPTDVFAPVPIPADEPTDVFDAPAQADEPTDILPAVPLYDEPTDVLDAPERTPAPVRRPVTVEYQPSPPQKTKRRNPMLILVVVFAVLAAIAAAVYGGRFASAKAHCEKGSNYSLSGQYESAVYEYSEAIRLSGNTFDAYLHRALAYVELKRYSDAVSDYEASGSSQYGGRFAKAYYEHGKSLRKNKSFYRAEEAFSRAILLRGDYAEAYFLRGIVKYESADEFDVYDVYDDATRDYEKAIALKPDMRYTKSSVYAGMFCRLAQEAYWDGDFAAGMLNYDKAIDHGPDRKETWLARAESFYWCEDDYDNALKDIAKAIALDDRYAQAYGLRASFYSWTDNNARAIADYTKCISLEPGNADWYYQRADCYRYFDQYSDAIWDYTQAIRLEPEYDYYYFLRGIVYESASRYGDAIDDYKKAIELDPDQWDYCTYLADAYKAIGCYREANDVYTGRIDELTREIRRDGSDDELYYQRAYFYRAMEMYDAALQDYETGFGLDPDDHSHLWCRAQIYETLEQYGNAILEYDRLINLNPGDSSNWYNRGWCYEALGQMARANADYARAEELGW